MMSADEARKLYAAADLIFDANEVNAAVHRVADQLNRAYADKHPLVLSVMGGAVVFTGQLLPLLTFPLEFDIVAASRYGAATSGSQLEWRVAPRANIKGRDVLVLDDILDEGITLAAIVDLIRTHGPLSCK